MAEELPRVDKSGEELDKFRFQLLQDIARDLSDEAAFPTSFDLVVRLRKALQDPTVSVDRIVGLISIEPLIPLHLVHLANSAAYSRGNMVKDVKSAIQRLGLETVRSSAISVALKQLLRSKDMAIFAEITQRLWEHSLRTACAAQVISRSRTRVNPDVAMLAGLVHDIGAFYLLYRFSQIEELRIRPLSAQYLVERWHGGVGYTLMMGMGIPEEIAEACQEHDSHREVSAHPQTLEDVVYISNMLAGGVSAWLIEPCEETEAEKRLVGDYQSCYGDLMDEIGHYEKSMRHILE